MADHESDNDYPLAKTKARRMLALGLEQKQRTTGLGQREIAEKLGYKSSVVLSHMALGRVPIPIDKAPSIAKELDLDPGEFLISVLEQRHPDIAFQTLLNVSFSSDRTVARLEAAAGCSLNDLPDETISVLEEVVAARTPKRRWLTIQEAPIMDLIRRLRPKVTTEGLDQTDRQSLAQALSK
jgi:transcriptional regulator with XRE-family HTH domain